MIVCVPVTGDGRIDPRWGRANRVAIADVQSGTAADWREYDVSWGSLHDSGTEGSHHARVAHFLREHGVEAVVAHHMGYDMHHMLQRMGLKVRLGSAGDARSAAVTAATQGASPGP